MTVWDRKRKARTISVLATAVAVGLAAGRATALQTDVLDACRVKRDYEAAKRTAEQAAQEFAKMKAPQEAKGQSQLDDVAWVHNGIDDLKDITGYALNAYTYNGHTTNYRLRLQKLLGISREDYIALYYVGDDLADKVEPRLYSRAEVDYARRRIKEIEARGKELEKSDPELQWIVAQIKSREDWLQASARLVQVQNRVADLQELYNAATSAKNAALAKARGDLDSVARRFREERDRLQALPHDDSYLRQSLRLIAGTRAALMAMRMDLAHYDCWDDVKSFVATELDARILRLDAALRNRPAPTPPSPPGTSTAPAGPDAGAPAVSDANVWVAEKPVIDTRPNNGLTVTEKDVTVTSTVNGKTYTATVSWRGIPTRVKAGERVTLHISASGDLPGRALGWFNVYCAGKWYQTDNNAASWPQGKGTGKTYNAGVLEFDFDPGSSPSIQVSAGVDPPGRWATITWKYHKAGPNDRPAPAR